MTKYRIVTDHYCGFEVQAWRWWMPFWMQVGVNTFVSAERAEEWVAAGCPRRGRATRKIVKVLP